MKELYKENPKDVAEFVEEFCQDEVKFKQAWAQQARTWTAFANGDQNPYPYAAPIIVNNNPSNYSTQNDTRLNMYQGDELEAIIRTLVSYATRQEPTVNCYALNKDQKSKNIARVAKRFLDAKYEIDNERELTKKAVTNSLIYGTVFGKDFWDYSAGGYIFTTDDMGNPELDEEGNPIYSRSGNNACGIYTPLSISLDHSILDFNRQPILIDSYMVDVDWAKKAYSLDMPGYTGWAGEIQEESTTEVTLKIQQEMKFAIPYVTWGTNYRTKGQTLLREVYIEPRKGMPSGRMLVVIGNVVCYDSFLTPRKENPYFLEQEATIWHPFTCLKYEEFVGRFLGKSLVEGLVPLQLRLNEINGAILENANTLAKPNLCAANGQLKKGVANGKGATIYTYNHTPGIAPPFVLTGTPLPSQFFTERQQIIEQMVRKAGTNMAMQGNPPAGVTAAAAIQMLLENANSQQSAYMQSLTRFLELRYTKKLRFAHKFQQYPDPNLAKYLRHLDKDFLNTEIDDFVASRDLADGINIQIEPGSMIPQSNQARTAVYMDLAKTGGLGPALAEDSPRGDNLRNQLMEKINIEPLESEENIEMKKADWENELMMSGQPMPVSEFDIAAIHLPRHIRKLQDPVFLERATPEQKTILYNHIKLHQQEEQNKQMMPPQPMPEDMGQGMMPPEAIQGNDLAAPVGLQ